MNNWQLQLAYMEKFGALDWGDVPKVCATVGTWDDLMETLRSALKSGEPVDWGKAILTLSNGQVYEPSEQELMAANSPTEHGHTITAGAVPRIQATTTKPSSAPPKP